MNDFWSGLSLFLVVLTLAVYFFQYRAMLRQVNVSRAASHVQSLLSLIELLQEKEAKTGRWWVMQHLRDKDLEQWSPKDRFFASRACSRFDLVGLIVRMNVVPSQELIDSWAPSICRVFHITSTFRAELKRKNGQDYWGNYDWLAERAEQVWSDPDADSVLDQIASEEGQQESSARSVLSLSGGDVVVEIPAGLSADEVDKVRRWTDVVLGNSSSEPDEDKNNLE